MVDKNYKPGQYGEIIKMNYNSNIIVHQHLAIYYWCPGQGEERRGEERGELMIVVSPSLNFTILKFLLYLIYVHFYKNEHQTRAGFY